MGRPKKTAISEAKELAVVKPALPANASPIDSLLAMAIDKNFDADKLEKLIALKNSEQERMAKEDFERNFQLMQVEYPTITRTKEVKRKSGELLYKFCPLSNIMKLFGPLLSQHGFSWRWEKTPIADKIIRITSIIAGYGHEKRASIDIPIISPPNEATNAIQQVGSSISYGERYSFMANAGIVISGEDDDGKKAASDKAHDNPSADAGFEEIMALVPKEKQGQYRDQWDVAETKELPLLYKNTRAAVFMELLEVKSPEQVRSYTEKWGKCKTAADYISLLKELTQ